MSHSELRHHQVSPYMNYLLGLLCSSLCTENVYLHGTVSKKVHLRRLVNIIKKSEIRVRQYDNM
jgi:hypothetical protein